MNEANDSLFLEADTPEVCEVGADVGTDTEEGAGKGDGTLDEISLLREEVQKLRAQLGEREELDRANSRMRSELAEFYECFPDAQLEEIPDGIWEKVKRGASLSAEYSLFERKKEIAKKRIGDLNEKNRKMSSGSLGFGDTEKYYSPAEVKKMSPAQVKANYDDIIESMRHWN